jgi:hypothetical protein
VLGIVERLDLGCFSILDESRWDAAPTVVEDPIPALEKGDCVLLLDYTVGTAPSLLPSLHNFDNKAKFMIFKSETGCRDEKLKERVSILREKWLVRSNTTSAPV